MTCIQLADGGLLLHSPNKFDLETYETLATIGKIKFLIVPSLMHNSFVMDWKKQNQESLKFAPAKVKKLQADFELDHEFQEQIDQHFNGEVTCIPIDGMPIIQENAFIHHASKTHILTDLAFNFTGEPKVWTRSFLKAYGAYDKFGPTITIRTLIRNKHDFRESLNKVMMQDFDRIIMSHGRVIEQNGKETLERGFHKYL